MNLSKLYGMSLNRTCPVDSYGISTVETMCAFFKSTYIYLTLKQHDILQKLIANRTLIVEYFL